MPDSNDEQPGAPAALPEMRTDVAKLPSPLAGMEIFTPDTPVEVEGNNGETLTFVLTTGETTAVLPIVDRNTSSAHNST
jgi:hypothetical protein